MQPVTCEENLHRVRALAGRWPWPEVRPDYPFDGHGWLTPGTRSYLAEAVTNHPSQVILELGSWLGKSARFLLDQAPTACLIAVDHWQGSREHRRNPRVAERLCGLYERWLANNWDYRDRLIPVRLTSRAALEEVHGAGVYPDLVFIDASHETPDVVADLETVVSFWPSTRVVGDDWTWKSVRAAVKYCAVKYGLLIEARGNGWRVAGRK